MGDQRLDGGKIVDSIIDIRIAHSIATWAIIFYIVLNAALID